MSFTSAPRWRDVHLAAGVRGITVAGDFIAATTLALALQGRGESGLAVAAVMLATAVPLMVIAPIGGRLADRVDSRILLVLAGTVQFVACLLLAYASQTAVMVALAGVIASGLALTSPTLSALLPTMVGRELLPKATALMSSASSVGMLVAPAVAGLLVGEFGMRVPLLASAVTYLANVAAGLLLRTRRGGRSAAERDLPAAPAAPAWRLRADTLLLAMVIGTGITIAALSAVNVANVFFVRATLHASASTYGLLEAIWTATMLVGAWLAARGARRGGDGRLALALFALFGATSLTILGGAGAPHVLWLVPLFVIGGVFNGAENVIASVIIARRVPDEVRGRAIGMFVGAVNAAHMIGFLIGGVVLGVLAPRIVVALAGAAGSVAVIACLSPILRVVRREAAVTNLTPQPAAATAAG